MAQPLNNGMEFWLARKEPTALCTSLWTEMPTIGRMGLLQIKEHGAAMHPAFIELPAEPNHRYESYRKSETPSIDD